MSRATNIIELMEAGGLEPSNVTTMKLTGRRTHQSAPKGVGDLSRAQGFRYGSGGKKTPDMEDSEIENSNVDAPVLTGNMFKRDASQDRDTSNKRKPALTAMTGLRG